MEVLIDGYNVMYSTDREWPGTTFKARREEFLRRLQVYNSGRPHKITVVFDGAKGGTPEGGSESVYGIRVVFSPRGVEADSVLRDILDRAVKPADYLLVSSDKSLSGYARGVGASTARSDELVGKLRPPASPSRMRSVKRRQRLGLW